MRLSIVTLVISLPHGAFHQLAQLLALKSKVSFIQLLQRLACLFPVIKMMTNALYLLVSLMTFTGDQHRILGTGAGDRQADRSPPVRLHHQVYRPGDALHAFHDGRTYRSRIFTPGIVGRDYHLVCQLGCDLSHHRALRPVSIAPLLRTPPQVAPP